jgi:hypothetical protein
MLKRRRHGLIAHLSMLVWMANPALAQESKPSSSPASESPERARPRSQPSPSNPESKPGEPAPQSNDEKPPPADEARGYEKPPGTEPEDAALFVPRVVLAIPRYALRFVFFPIQLGLEFVDEHALIERTKDVLYNDERTAGIVPRLSIDTFFGPTIGAKAFHDDLAGHGEHGSLSFVVGGRYEQAYQVAFRADRYGGSRLWLESVTRFETEPGLLFQGIGQPPVRETGSSLDPREAAVETRYRQQRLLSLTRLGYTVGEPGALTKLGMTGIYNVREFGRKGRGAEPSTEEVYDTSAIVGFDSRVSVFETDVNLVVDTRNVAGATSRGAYVELFGGWVPPLGDYDFFHHGLEATGYVNLYKETRVLVLRGVVEGVEGETEDIPFSELPRLGGPNRLRGYPLDRFRDEKAVVGTVEYHYPIHQFVAGSLYVDVGRVAESYDEMIDEHGWNTGIGAGFIFRSRNDVLFTFDVAYGDGVQFHFTTDPLRAFGSRDTEL